ncbi:MAG: PAS domain-containing protein [Saprospiraceae bacterium]|nr:PAS domain-containing protein [Saprospiraceae bacterium]
MIPYIAVIVTDAQRRILWVNEDFTEMTGYTLSEVIGKKPSILQGPKSEPDAVKRIRKGLESQTSIKDTITNYRKNGEAYPCKLVIHPIYDPDHKLTNFIAFEVDGLQVEDEEKLPIMQIKEKYSSSSLKGVEELKLYFRLKSLIESEKIYLNPNLTLKSVADQLSTNTKYLSQVVNHHAGTHFQNFINAYRVEDVKQKINQAAFRNLTLFGIALQCGFKNKSTFYKVFKEICGITPRDFLKSNKNGQTAAQSRLK